MTEAFQRGEPKFKGRAMAVARIGGDHERRISEEQPERILAAEPRHQNRPALVHRHIASIAEEPVSFGERRMIFFSGSG